MTHTSPKWSIILETPKIHHVNLKILVGCLHLMANFNTVAFVQSPTSRTLMAWMIPKPLFWQQVRVRVMEGMEGMEDMEGLGVSRDQDSCFTKMDLHTSRDSFMIHRWIFANYCDENTGSNLILTLAYRLHGHAEMYIIKDIMIHSSWLIHQGTSLSCKDLPAFVKFIPLVVQSFLPIQEKDRPSLNRVNCKHRQTSQ